MTDSLTGSEGHSALADHFRELHNAAAPLLLPNAWDVGSARILKSLGFAAIATTSSGFAATLGRADGAVTRDEAIEHAEMLARATNLPVSADLENGFADDPAGVAETARLACQAGLAGFSIEDYSGRAEDPIYPADIATGRVCAAAEVAHAGPARLVLTARTENYLHGRIDLADVIHRLQRFQEAGADVLYAPGLTSLDDIAAVVRSVDMPVNVLVLPSGPSIAQLAACGVRRISVGGAFAFAAYGALVEAARELSSGDSTTYFERARLGGEAARAAFAR